MPKLIDNWNSNNELLRQELEKLEITMLPRDYVAKKDNGELVNLGRWIETQIASLNKGVLSSDRQESLKKSGLNINETKVKFFVKTSFPEQALAFYLSQYMSEIGAVNSNDMSTGKDLDILIPDKGIAIEYDGFNYHKERTEEDIKRNEELSAHGYDVIRIREHGLSDLDNCQNIQLESSTSNYYGDVDKMIKTVFEHLNQEYDLNLNTANIDSKRDCSDIYLRHKLVRDAEFDEFKAALKNLTAGETTKKGKVHRMAYMSKSYKDSFGFPLGKVAERYRDYAKRGILPQRQVDELNEMNFVWNPNQVKIKDIEKSLTELKKEDSSFSPIPDIYKLENMPSVSAKTFYKQLDTFRKELSAGKFSESDVEHLKKFGINITMAVPSENKLLYDKPGFWKDLSTNPSLIKDIVNVQQVVAKANIKGIEDVSDFYAECIHHNHKAYDFLPESYKKEPQVLFARNDAIKTSINKLVKSIENGSISAKKLEEIKASFNKEEKALFEKLNNPKKQEKAKGFKL
jgi:hypothetical protein